MKILFSHRVSGSPEKVYKALTDPEILKGCIEGCESLVPRDEYLYDVKLRVGGAGMKGTVRILSSLSTESLTLEIAGKGLPGSIKAVVPIKLVGIGAETEVSGESEVTVGGFAAALGSKLLESGAKSMIQDFFTKLSGQLTSSAT
ncbi:MAG TPA: SRPBCC domain-containing protein [Planctomycetota bacterium]|nr:SRPBCC domain-containing protein [Planctomycetota bacterium]